MRSPRPSASTEAGFTLVEMLVAMAILALIMVLVSQLTNSAMLSTGLSGKHLDTDSEARAVFDRMSADFARMPQRKDVDFIFAKQPGSDKMFFFSEAPGYFDTTNSSLFPSAGGNSTDPRSSVSLIGYCINTGSNNSGTALTPPAYCLQRLSKGLAWDAQSPATGNPGGVFFLTFAPGNLYPLTASTLAGNSYTSAAVGSPPAYSGTDPDFDVVANLVLRMEFCFQVKDLTNPNSPASAYSNYPIAHFAAGAANQATAQSSAPSNPSVGDRWYDTANNRAYLCAGLTGGVPSWTPNGLADVSAIIVAIAILDPASRAVVPNQLANVSNALADVTDANLASQPPVLMAQTWQAALNGASPTFAGSAGIPVPAAAQIRVYQRYFYLNNK